MKNYISILVLLLVVHGCSSDSSNNGQSGVDLGGTNIGGADVSTVPDADDSSDAGVDVGTEDMAVVDVGPDGSVEDAGEPPPFGGDRPAKIVLPQDYDAAKQYPLVTLLHGYGATGAIQDSFLGLSANVTARQFILIVPDGTVDSGGRRFWNATNFCCDFQNTGIDDQTYLMGLVDEAIETYSIDESAIFFMGHSNGGFMSYTLACEFGDRIAGIASLAGTSHVQEEACPDTGDVSILQIHGTLDETIAYAGSGFFPGAVEVAERWAARNECDAPVDGDNIDFDTAIVGDETTVRRWQNGSNGTDVELWTIETAGHIPSGIATTFAPMVLDHLFARKKP